MALTLDEFKATKGNHPEELLTGTGGVIVTSFSDTADLANPAIELYALTAGTAVVIGVDGETVTFLEADLVALNNRIPFAVKRILSTGTSVTRFLAVV
jgi:hypothetical protein